jgi:hypothetical protein
VSDNGISRGKRKRGDGFNMDVWWADRSLAQKIVFGTGFGILGIGFIAGLTWVVMLLWNWVMPDLLGLHRVGYWKAGGLMVLCWILFKGIKLGQDNSSKSADRKRRQQLRSYMTEDQAASEDAPTDSPSTRA